MQENSSTSTAPYAATVDYLIVKLTHQSTVALSLTGFLVRGAASFAGARWLTTRLAKTLPHVIDTVLLVSALTLAWMLRATPMNSPWLFAKIAGVIGYIGLGVIALRPGSSKPYSCERVAGRTRCSGMDGIDRHHKKCLGHFFGLGQIGNLIIRLRASAPNDAGSPRALQ